MHTSYCQGHFRRINDDGIRLGSVRSSKKGLQIANTNLRVARVLSGKTPGPRAGRRLSILRQTCRVIDQLIPNIQRARHDLLRHLWFPQARASPWSTANPRASLTSRRSGTASRPLLGRFFAIIPPSSITKTPRARHCSIASVIRQTHKTLHIRRVPRKRRSSAHLPANIPGPRRQNTAHMPGNHSHINRG